MTRRRKIILGSVATILLCCMGSIVSAIFFPDSEESEDATSSRSQVADITESEAEVEAEPTQEEAEATATPQPTSTSTETAVPATNTAVPTNTATATTEPTATDIPATNTPAPTAVPPTAMPATAVPVAANTAAPPTNTPVPPTAVPTQPPPPTAVPTLPPAPTEPPPASSSDVQITFVRFNGDINPSEPDEYAVIQNTGAGTINLSGWRLNAGDPGQDFNFPGIDLGPGQSCRVYTNQVHPESCGGGSFGSGSAIWLNSGDCGYLFDSTGAQVSRYCYNG